MKIAVYNIKGAETKSMEVSALWESVPEAGQAVADTVRAYLSNARTGTAKTKNRNEVNFTTKKPWRQKGTGRARAGTAGSPIWRKGGVVFGPRPRDFSVRIPKKVKRLALKRSVAGKLKNNNIVILEGIDIDSPRTKIVADMLKNMGKSGSALIISKDNNRIVRLSVRNLPGVDFIRAGDLNTYAVMSHNTLIVEKAAWKDLEAFFFSGKNAGV